MLFKGRLRLPGDAGEGIPIDLTLEDVFLTLDSGGEELGEWRLDVVEISRLFSNQFSLLLDGEEMVFVANDALGFAYEGLSFIEEVQSRLKKRRFFKGRKPKRSKAKPAPEPEPEPEEPARSTPTSDSVRDVPMPEVKPFFPEPAAERTALDQVAPAPTAEPPVTPEPLEPPAAPSRRGVHPLGDPDGDVVEPYLNEPSRVEEPPAPAPPAPAPAARATPDPAEPDLEATTPEGVDTPDEEAEDELVIEDVNPYGYQSPMTMIPEREARSEPESAAPATPTEQPERLVEPEPEPEPELEPEPEPLIEAETIAPPAAATAASPTPEPTFAETPSEQEDEDEAEPDDGPRTRVTQRTGRHATGESKTRSSLFGRRKSKEPEPHDHVYESSKTVGGITRSVCSVCGHVSFAGEDVYQNW